jgi:aspartate aminotransferase
VSLGSLPAGQERTISVYSLSKTYAMSGLRLGYVVVTQQYLLERMKKLVRCTINGVNSVAQYGAAAALNGSQDLTRDMAREYQKRRDILFGALEEAPYLQAFKPGGAFYLWARIQPDWPGYGGKSDDWSMTNYLIDRAGIGSSPGSAFGPAGGGHTLRVLMFHGSGGGGGPAVAHNVAGRHKSLTCRGVKKQPATQRHQGLGPYSLR